MNEKIKLRYGVDEKLPFSDTFFYGLQWLAVSLPTIVVLGQIVANLHFSDPQAQVNYMQKIFFVMALSMLLQLFLDTACRLSSGQLLFFWLLLQPVRAQV